MLAIFIFLRFFMLFERANLGWDQIDSAWAAKSILVDKHIFINGPAAKGNSGIYMGPLYYYLITPFYFFTHLDPIASPIFQAIISIGNIFILFFITKKLFGTNVALVASFISTFSITSMHADRVQSAFYFIVPMSYLIFYALYQVMCKKERYIFLLAVVTGLSFHVDFTSIFYPILILLAIPFFPRTKKTLLYILLAIPLFLLFLLPIFLPDFGAKHAMTSNVFGLLHNYYHGIHLKRILQLMSDAFISYGQILQFDILKYFQYLVLPIFMIVYYLLYPTKKTLMLFYLMVLWIVIPWIILSTYSGELTDYYFSLSRNIAIAILAFLTIFVYRQKFWLIKLLPIILWGIYAYYGLVDFVHYPQGDLISTEIHVKQTIKLGKRIPFADHHADSYIYYVYTH